MAIDKLAKFINEICQASFTGSIQINFFKGGISNIVKQESLKVEDLK